jgi:hypothetical protein
VLRTLSRSCARCVQNLTGLALLPAAAVFVLACADVLARLAARPRAALWFLAGSGAYALLYACALLRLRPIYVFAHESTHALAAWMIGGKVFSFSVGRESGRVDLSHSNLFIALAPYWVPLYALAVAAAYRFSSWSGASAHARELFLAAMGAALSFHLLHTAESLWSARQSDLDEAGTLLSLALILLLNALVLLAAFKCLFPRQVDLSASFLRSWGWLASSLSWISR